MLCWTSRRSGYAVVLGILAYVRCMMLVVAHLAFKKPLHAGRLSVSSLAKKLSRTNKTVWSFVRL